MQEINNLEEEIMDWPVIRQNIRVGADDSLIRELHVKNPFGFPLEDFPANRMYRFGWWDAKTKNWYFFRNGTPTSRSSYGLGFGKVELPSHFGGGLLLECFKYGEDRQAELLGRAGETVYGSLIKEAVTYEEIQHFPQIIHPVATPVRKEKLLLLGALYSGRKVYAVWFQSGLPVGLSLVPDLSALEGIQELPCRGIRFSKLKESKLKKINDAFYFSIARNRYIEQSSKMEEFFVTNQTIPRSYPRRLGTFWTPEEGWFFFDWKSPYSSTQKLAFEGFKKLSNEKSPFLSQLDRMCYLTEGDGFSLMNSHGQLKELGTLQKSSVPSKIPPLQINYPESNSHLLSSKEDKVLCILSGSGNDLFALIADNKGTPLGWELCFNLNDIKPDGALFKPHLRYFLEPPDLQEGVSMIKKILGNEIHL